MSPTIDFYNAFSAEFDKIPFEPILPDLLKELKPHQEILEIGSGPGALALWLKEQGHQILCIEPSVKAVEIARQKSLEVQNCTFQNFKPEKKYDVVLAISSLIHFRKSELRVQIGRIAQLLKQEGLFFVSFIEGKGEGLEDPTRKGMDRFFSKLTEIEIDELLKDDFRVQKQIRIESKKMSQTFILLALQKS